MIKNISHKAPYGLRIPEELKAKIDLAAEKNLRSQNSEMLARLRDSFDARQELKDFSDGELIQELIDRWGRDAVCIRLGAPAQPHKDDSANSD